MYLCAGTISSIPDCWEPIIPWNPTAWCMSEGEISTPAASRRESAWVRHARRRIPVGPTAITRGRFELPAGVHVRGGFGTGAAAKASEESLVATQLKRPGDRESPSGQGHGMAEGGRSSHIQLLCLCARNKFSRTPGESCVKDSPGGCGGFFTHTEQRPVE